MQPTIKQPSQASNPVGDGGSIYKIDVGPFKVLLSVKRLSEDING